MAAQAARPGPPQGPLRTRLSRWLLALPFGLAIGLSLGALGGGGAVLALPVLVYVLGQDVHAATTESLAVVAAAALAGGAVQASRARVCWPQVVLFAPAALVGAVLGHLRRASGERRRAADRIRARPAGRCGVHLAACRRRRGHEDRACPPLDRDRTLIAGVAVGLLTGFFGVGGGFLVVPMLALAMRFPLRRAIGTSLVIVGFVSLAGAGRPPRARRRDRRRRGGRDGSRLRRRRARRRAAERTSAPAGPRARLRGAARRRRRLHPARERAARRARPAPERLRLSRTPTGTERGSRAAGAPLRCAHGNRCHPGAARWRRPEGRAGAARRDRRPAAARHGGARLRPGRVEGRPGRHAHLRAGRPRRRLHRPRRDVRHRRHRRRGGRPVRARAAGGAASSSASASCSSWSPAPSCSPATT